MIERMRRIADALEHYLRAGGDMAQAVCRRADAETQRIAQSMRLDAEHAELQRRTVEANERSTAQIPVFIDVLKGVGPAITRIEAKLDAWASPTSSDPGGKP